MLFLPFVKDSMKIKNYIYKKNMEEISIYLIFKKKNKKL